MAERNLDFDTIIDYIYIVYTIRDKVRHGLIIGFGTELEILLSHFETIV